MNLRVCWCQMVSEQFDVSGGVRQGGILLLLLFMVYINNDLLVQLAQ